MKRQGFTLDSELIGLVTFKPCAIKDLSDVKDTTFDFVVVCTKALPGTAAIIAAAVSYSTTIVLFQNGIGIEEEYVKAYPNNTIISAVVYVAATEISPGHVTMGAGQSLELGTFAHHDAFAQDKVATFADIVNAGGFTAVSFSDIQSRRWRKLIVNAAWNPLCALTRLGNAKFFASSDHAKRLARDISSEIVCIARACGYEDITEEVADAMFARPSSRPSVGNVEPSMLTDVRMQRRIEVEALVGNPRRIAKNVGVPTPLLDVVYVLVRGLDEALASGKA